MLTLELVRAARERIAPFVRYTPLLEAVPTRRVLAEDARVFLKLECLQISGSFKARGAMNKTLSLPKEQVAKGLITASGGNHGLGVAYAGWTQHVPVSVYLSHNSPQIKARKLAGWGAQVIYEGDVWDDANRAAQAAALDHGRTYIHPFADITVMAGQGTISLEVLEQLPEVDVILVAIGGGGLISGVSYTIKQLKPKVRVIGIEPVGAPTLLESRKAGKVVELAEINTKANTLAPRMSAQINHEIISQYVDEIVLVSDEEMVSAAQWLWRDMNIAAEMSGAAALAALMHGRVPVRSGETCCVLVCGAGLDGIEE